MSNYPNGFNAKDIDGDNFTAEEEKMIDLADKFNVSYGGRDEDGEIEWLGDRASLNAFYQAAEDNNLI